METILRPASQSDAPALADFAREAFRAKFGHLYSDENLAAFFAQARTPEIFEQHIAHDHTCVMLAEQGGHLRAYSLTIMGKAFDERPEPRPDRPAYLGQLYCAADATGQGLGGRLLARVVADAVEWGADAVQLSVFSENFDAQRFYRQHGFEHVADIHFMVGNHRDDEHLFELTLPGHLRR